MVHPDFHSILTFLLNLQIMILHYQFQSQRNLADPHNLYNTTFICHQQPVHLLQASHNDIVDWSAALE